MSLNVKWRRGICGMVTAFAVMLGVLLATICTPAYAATESAPVSIDEVQSRAAYWFDAKHPAYDQGATTTDANGVSYRTDCSGYVSMAWDLPSPGLTTSEFGNTADFPQVPWDQVRPGDALLKSGHIALVHSWSNGSGEIWEMANPRSDMMKRTLTASEAQAEGYHAIRDPNITSTPQVSGAIDAVSVDQPNRIHVSGWTMAGSTPIQVELQLNGQTVATVNADQEREDLPSSTKNHGFDFSVEVIDGTYDACLFGTGAGLSAVQLGCSTVTVTSPYQILPQMMTEWQQLGVGATGVPIGPHICSLTPAGCEQPFEHGVMYWSSGHGSRFVDQHIQNTYEQLGAQKSHLGYPTDSVTGCDPTAGCTQHFQHGSIFWSAATGAVVS